MKLDKVLINKLKSLQLAVLEKNKQINLTSIRDPQEFWDKHILDSLELANIPEMREILGNYAGINSKKEIKVIDVGSGAGFPGLPLAIAFCHINFTLIDSTRKKVDAISEFIQKLKITSAESIWARSEDLGRKGSFFEAYDLVIARSVAFLPNLIEITHNLVKKGGYLAFYKLENEDELAAGLKAAKDHGIEYIKAHVYKLPKTSQNRAIYIFRKL